MASRLYLYVTIIKKKKTIETIFESRKRAWKKKVGRGAVCRNRD